MTSLFKSLFILFFLTGSFFALPSQGSGEEGDPFAPHIERFRNGTIDWKAGIIYGTGKGYPDMNGGSKAAAASVARATAMNAIVKIASGLNLDDQTVLNKLGNGRGIIHIHALIHPEHHESRWTTDGERPCIEVTLKTPVSGVEGITTRLLGLLKEHPDLWKDLPEKPLASAIENEGAPWLVIDARGAARNGGGVRPALFPKIKSASGEVLYELKRVDERAVQTRGMASYVITSEPKERLAGKRGLSQNLLDSIGNLIKVQEAFAGEPRKKRKRFIVTDATAMEGVASVNLLVSHEEASRLKKEDQASMILKKCRVIVIVNSPIGGVKGSIDPLRIFSRVDTP
jgi:hypothetical protein